MRRPARVDRWTLEGVWLVLGAWLLFYLLVYGLYAYSLLRFPFDYDQGEGYDVNSAWSLARGWPIYASPDLFPFYSSNYPPLYSLLLAPLVSVFGPQLPLGRLLSLGAVAVAMLVIGLAVRGQTGRLRPAILAALVFLASPYVYHVTPLARINALTLALSLLGVYLLGRVADARPRHAPGWYALGGAVLLAALFAKQMALDAAAAALLYLTLRDPGRGIRLGLAVLLVGASIYLLLDASTGGGFSLNVLWANANPFSVDQAVAYYRNFLGIHPLLVGAAIAITVADLLRRGSRGLSVWSFYLVFALLVATGTGKWGAGESYFLPAIAAACVLTGRGLGMVEVWGERLATGKRRLASAGTLALLALGLLALGGWQLRLLWHGQWTRPDLGLYDRGVQAAVLGRRPTLADIRAGERVVSHLREAPGEVLAEESGFALVAGRRVLGNATQQRNLFEAGRHDPSALVAALDKGEVSVVILNAQQYPPPVLAAIGRNCYAVDAVEMNGFRYLVLYSGHRRW